MWHCREKKKRKEKRGWIYFPDEKRIWKWEYISCCHGRSERLMFDCKFEWVLDGVVVVLGVVGGACWSFTESGKSERWGRRIKLDPASFTSNPFISLSLQCELPLSRCPQTPHTALPATVGIRGRLKSHSTVTSQREDPGFEVSVQSLHVLLWYTWLVNMASWDGRMDGWILFISHQVIQWHWQHRKKLPYSLYLLTEATKQFLTQCLLQGTQKNSMDWNHWDFLHTTYHISRPVIAQWISELSAVGQNSTVWIPLLKLKFFTRCRHLWQQATGVCFLKLKMNKSNLCPNVMAPGRPCLKGYAKSWCD